jgi:hypothetical protein
MYLMPQRRESPSATSIALSEFRKLDRILRNCAHCESIRAENCRPGATRTRHVWRAEAFLEAADIVERCMALRDEK